MRLLTQRSQWDVTRCMFYRTARERDVQVYQPRAVRQTLITAVHAASQIGIHCFDIVEAYFHALLARLPP